MNRLAISAAWPGASAVHAVRLVLPALALLALLVPTYHDVALRLWKYDENAYAPLLTGLAFLLIWHRFRQLELTPDPGVSAPGLLLLLLGAAVYVLGRSQRIELLELGACIPMTAGVLALFGGRRALRKMQFPLLFLLFTLPYPGWLIDRLTGSLKEWISIGSEAVLYAAGYPIARSGVALALGPYQLLVADACSGLHSLIFLAALGLLYIHLTQPRQLSHRLLLMAALLPIAVLANFIRVLILLLLTYHFGDAVGQGYSHELAGLILFASAFAMLIALDRQLSRHFPKPAGTAENGTARNGAALSWMRCIAVALFMLATAAAATLLAPTRLLAERHAAPHLESGIPHSFGDWVQDDAADALLVAPALQSNVERLYSQTIARTYVNRQGQRIMLSIAYGGHQMGNELQAHRPEYCYKAQGYTVSDAQDGEMPTPSGILPVRRLVARQNNRTEPITYWMTVGETAALPGVRRKLAQLRYGLQGEIPDGMLIRVSSLNSAAGQAYSLHQSFIADLYQALPDALRHRIAPPSSSQLRD